MTDLVEQCRTCGGEGWVCENHRDRAWEGGYAKCCGGAGQPCGSCSLELAAAGSVDRASKQAAATIERQAALLREAREGLERIALGMVDGDPDSPHSMYMRARELARTTLAKLENAA